MDVGPVSRSAPTVADLSQPSEGALHHSEMLAE